VVLVDKLRVLCDKTKPLPRWKIGLLQHGEEDPGNDLHRNSMSSDILVSLQREEDLTVDEVDRRDNLNVILGPSRGRMEFGVLRTTLLKVECELHCACL
jgi:hypothetical protein